jgi:hypothetical protein
MSTTQDSTGTAEFPTLESLIREALIPTQLALSLARSRGLDQLLQRGLTLQVSNLQMMLALLVMGENLDTRSAPDLHRLRTLHPTIPTPDQDPSDSKDR